ncbi:MAG: hypothetical protein ACOYOL_06000 [Chthoniobacterales bacterium]
MVRWFVLMWALYGILQTVGAFVMNVSEVPELVLLAPGGAALLLSVLAWLYAPGAWIAHGRGR